MPSGGLHDEIRGIRGSWLYKRVKEAFARAAGRAFWYDHLTAAVDLCLSTQQRRGRPLSYYEFGTGSGNTLQRALTAVRAYRDSSIVLFDSFQGLPEPADRSDRHPFWEKGNFAFSEDYIRQVIRKSRYPVERARFVSGFFEQSLTEGLQAELRSSPPAFVTIDVDYYSSTVLVLKFLKPLLSSGVMIFFDDLHAFDCHPDYGELRALREFNDENPDGQLVVHPVLGNRIYIYYRNEYEHAPT